jgi:hypothetical protein
MFASLGIAPVGRNRTKNCTGSPFPLLPIALVTTELDDFPDMLEGQVERRLSKLLY